MSEVTSRIRAHAVLITSIVQRWVVVSVYHFRGKIKMSEDTLQELIIINDVGESVQLYVTPEEIQRATKDSAFTLNLLNKEYARRRMAENDAVPVKDVPTTSFGSKSSSEENVEDSIIEGDKTLLMWPTRYVYLLLQKYEERMHEFSSGSKRHFKIWESIASDISKVDPMVTVSGPQCQSKMNSLKMYKKVIDHNNISGNDRKLWQYFERMDELFGTSGWANPKALASDAGPSSYGSTDKNGNEKIELAIKKLKKSDKVLDDFMKQIKQDRQEREKIREERKEAMLKKIQNEKQKQHEEKMDVMKKFCEAISGKKLF